MEVWKNNIKISELTEELGEEAIYFKSEEEVKTVNKEVFKAEMKKLVPFSEL